MANSQYYMIYIILYHLLKLKLQYIIVLNLLSIKPNKCFTLKQRKAALTELDKSLAK